jgi:uncharacterized protein with HEPN domain
VRLFVPPRQWKLRLEDILEAMHKIQRYTSGMTTESFFTESQTIEAVAYNFIVMGEAARHIPPEVEARYPEVPWLLMRDMRNFLAHEYPRVKPEVIWDTIVRDLPPLVTVLQRILTEEDASQFEE